MGSAGFKLALHQGCPVLEAFQDVEMCHSMSSLSDIACVPFAVVWRAAMERVERPGIWKAGTMDERVVPPFDVVVSKQIT